MTVRKSVQGGGLTEGAVVRHFRTTAADGKVHVNVLVHAETLGLPLARIAELFDVKVRGISKHLKNIFDSGELSREETVSKLETVQTEGGRGVRRQADEKALAEYAEINRTQKIESDFDRVVKVSNALGRVAVEPERKGRGNRT